MTTMTHASVVIEKTFVRKNKLEYFLCLHQNVYFYIVFQIVHCET